jgi:hypothetical protein
MYRKERGCASPTGPEHILVTQWAVSANCCIILQVRLLFLTYLDTGER